MSSSLFVDVRLKKGIPSASRVDIEPLSPDDWEVLELHAGHVEEQLLNQARVVSTSCILPIWIMHSTLIRYNVTSCHSSSGPCTSVLLAPSTEVVVAPKQRIRDTPAPAPAVTSSPHKIFLRVLPAEWLHPTESPSHQSLSNPYGDSRCLKTLPFAPSLVSLAPPLESRPNHPSRAPPHLPSSSSAFPSHLLSSSLDSSSAFRHLGPARHPVQHRRFFWYGCLH